VADNISQIKERLNVVDVISSYIKVNKAGANFKARCPFHNEKTPSFYISPERQIWHCFGCQKGGDIFSFVKDMEGVEFGEALSILAQRAGVKLERFDPKDQDAKSILYEISETSTRFFEKQLYHSSVGKKALSYLRDRGISDDIIKEFRLGFAPEGWHNLSHFLRDCGYSEKDIADAGVALKKEGGFDIHDRFRSRIMFPIADINDRIVGFTGRVFGDDHPADVGKYINTPQTLIYDKSRVLYGLNKAKAELRRSDRCLLVEGNIDVIMSYQAGVKNVAGTSGTALTPSHLQLLQRYTNNLDFCFDSDQAGLVATRRGIGLALSQNFNIKVVSLQDPECKDPADYVKKFGDKWQGLVDASKPVIEFYFDKLKSQVDLASADGKKALIVGLGPLIKRLSSRVERSHWVSKLAIALKTKEDAVEADIISVRDDLDSFESREPVMDQKKALAIDPLPEDILSQALLAVILKKPSLFKDDLESFDVSSVDLLASEAIIKLKSDIDDFNFDKFIKEFDRDAAMKLEFAYLKSQEMLKDFSDDELKAEFAMIKNSLEYKLVTAGLTALEFDIKASEAANDNKKLSSLLIKFTELSKKLR
jgi:DNA primase